MLVHDKQIAAIRIRNGGTPCEFPDSAFGDRSKRSLTSLDQSLTGRASANSHLRFFNQIRKFRSSGSNTESAEMRNAKCELRPVSPALKRMRLPGRNSPGWNFP